MVRLASDSGDIAEFARLIQDMTERQGTTCEQLDPVLEDLASLLRRNAPRAAALIAEKLPARTRPIHKNPGVDTVADFVLEGGDVNIQDSGGDTLLHIAAKEGKEELLDTLLAYGADTRIGTPREKRPVDVARSALIKEAILRAAMLGNSRCCSEGDPPKTINSKAELLELSATEWVLLFTNSAVMGDVVTMELRGTDHEHLARSPPPARADETASAPMLGRPGKRDGDERDSAFPAFPEDWFTRGDFA